MLRGLMVLAGFLLCVVGFIVTAVMWSVTGWTVLAAVGVGLLAVDLAIEDRKAVRR